MKFRGENVLKKVEIYTDGACSGNPGPGGWGAVLRFGEYEREISGGEIETTNNRMELSAVINALKMLNQPCDIVLCSDSKYVCDAIEKGWLKKWQSNNWIRNKNNPVLNSDLWKQLVELLSKHTVHIKWVKGHAGHPENERCDSLAVAAIKKLNR